MARAYYNEINKTAAAWLRNLIAAGTIADGDVDERSIEDVTPGDLRGYTQCHFFAGLGGWSYALRLAGWADNRPVWTGSCPCQPFSQSGQGLGFADERHLWPSFFWLIQNSSPPVIFGEQVSGADGLEWFDVVFADLEKELYAVAGLDLCAASIGAPHIRQRLYWVADPTNERSRSSIYRMDNTHSERCKIQRLQHVKRETDTEITRASKISRMAYSYSNIEQRGVSGWEDSKRETINRPSGSCCSDMRSDSPDNYWRDVDWLFCRDGKWRPVKPGSFPLAHGISGRVGRVSAYGNAIVAPLAAEFIKAYMEIGK